MQTIYKDSFEAIVSFKNNPEGYYKTSTLIEHMLQYEKKKNTINKNIFYKIIDASLEPPHVKKILKHLIDSLTFIGIETNKNHVLFIKSMDETTGIDINLIADTSIPHPVVEKEQEYNGINQILANILVTYFASNNGINEFVEIVSNNKVIEKKQTKMEIEGLPIELQLSSASCEILLENYKSEYLAKINFKDKTVSYNEDLINNSPVDIKNIIKNLYLFLSNSYVTASQVPRPILKTPTNNDLEEILKTCPYNDSEEVYYIELNDSIKLIENLKRIKEENEREYRLIFEDSSTLIVPNTKIFKVIKKKNTLSQAENLLKKK